MKLTGLKYIHYLLSQYISNDFEAYEPISPLNLENVVDGVHPEAISQNQTRQNDDESNNVTKIYDNSVFKERGRLIEASQDLLKELREAEENNDPGRLESARNELERLNASIKKEYPHLFSRMDGKDPKDSEVKDQHERARKRVGDKINRTLAKVKIFDEELYHHLKGAIKRDKSALTYKPAKKIPWKI